MGLQYITPTQTIEISYEGKLRRFTIFSITPKGSFDQETLDASNLTENLEHLSIDAPPQLWTVGWDVVISLVNHESEKSTSSKVS